MAKKRPELWATRDVDGVVLTQGFPKNPRWITDEYSESPWLKADNDLDIVLCYPQFRKITGISLKNCQAVQLKVTAVGDIWDVLED